MSTAAPETREGPDRGRMPVVTMIGVALSLLLFAALVGLMFHFNKQFHKPADDAAERVQKLRELREADRAVLTTYGKTDKGYRIPIDRAMQLLADESAARARQEKESRR